MYLENRVRVVLSICIAFFFIWSSPFVMAISYPYELPEKIEATLDVNTQIEIPLDHMLVGLGWSATGYYGFNHSYSQDQVEIFQPSSIRFPSGVWSNFYDWEIDRYAIYDDYQGEYHDNVRRHTSWTPGFAGLQTVHDVVDFDVLFTWNVCYDSPAKGVSRLLDHESRGFDVKWIELGNENFYMDQRSNVIDTADKYVEVARAHSQALKAENSDVRLSVPAAWKNNGLHQATGDSAPWNTFLTADTSYYDAISVHIYNRPGETEEGVKQCLDAGQFVLDALEPVTAMFPDKPVWLSEWSVDCGDNAISVLGMADVYLSVFNHTDIFEMTQYFQVNSQMEPFFLFDSNTQVYTKTSFGAGYEVIRSVFEDSQMFVASTTSTEISPGLKAVRAEAVVKDGQLKVFALNRTTKNASLTLKFNGVEYTDVATHEVFAFTEVNDFYFYGMEEPVLTTVATGTTSIVLPPLSLNVITGLTINLNGPWNPYFYSDPLLKSSGQANTPYSDTLADSADDADSNESLTFSKIDGPDWLFVALNGELSGTPLDLDAGQNGFVVRVTDSTGRTGDTTLLIDVLPQSSPPLVAHWEFDEGTGTVAADSSGNGFIGTLLNGVTWRSDAFRGSHVSFDGENDRISTSLQYALSSSEDFTWAWWANKQSADGTKNGAIMVGNRYGGTGAENYEFIKFTPTETQFANTSTVADIEKYNYIDVPQNQWHHYAMVKTGTSCQWYVDGVAEGSPVTINYHESSAIPFLIGGDDDGSGTKVNEHFEGFIDDVRVYSYALTVPEIQELSYVELPSPDIVQNYAVDLADFSVLAANWLNSDCYSSDFCNGSDLNADQVVNQGDLQVLAELWLSPYDVPLVTLVDDFESYAVDTVMNNQTSAGPLGGLWDSDDEGTWHSTRAGKVILDGANQVVYQEYRSSGRRTLCVNGLTDPIDDGETGVLFFRFKAMATTNPISWYAGVHDLTGLDPLTVSSGDDTNKLVAGFHAVSSGGSTFDIKSVDDSSIFLTGLSQEQWYSVWMVVDHDLDTFDLYIEAAADGSGEAGDLPATAVGSDLPFEISTTNSLTGGLWHQAGGNSANVIFDEVAWSGAYSTP